MKNEGQLYQRLWLNLLVIVTIMSLGLYSSCFQSKNGVVADAEPGEWTPRIGGCGGVFFSAEKGPLIIEIEKQDLFPSKSPTAMRVIFTSPDREVLYDQWIPLSSLSAWENSDPGQSLQLKTNVERPGVYTVMITATYDRYGERIKWRFRTNCKKYIIETSRGHKDAKHKEPIVLIDPENASHLCFLPQTNAFDIRLTNLAEGIESVELRDAKDRQIAVLEVKNDTASYTMEQGERETIPWKLHFPKAQAKVEIEGSRNGVMQWTEPQVLVVAPFSHYSLYRHRLTIDREGRLFLSYFY